MARSLVRICTLGAALAAALSCAGVAQTGLDLRRVAAPLSLGIASEEPKWDRDGGGGYYSALADLGMTTSRLAITWDPARPLEIHERSRFDALLPQAAARGIDVSLVVTAAHPLVFSEPANRALLPNFLQLLARTYPQITTYVIGNEPNDSHFWRPQFGPDGRAVSPDAFVDLLARSYDALKAVNPGILVSAGGLVARGNDNPHAPSHISISPVRFIVAMGNAYRASGRSAPIMDEVSYHPYPQSARDSLLRSYAWPNAGIADLDRIKQAYWDAFHGSAQPTFEAGLRFNLDETGWQVRIADPHAGAYDGQEVSEVTDETRQAEIYGEMIRHVACDRSVKSLLIYRLTDDTNLAHWQSGLIRADSSRRPAYDAVKHAVAHAAPNCIGQMRSFRHVTTVVGAQPTFRLAQRSPRSRAFSFSITAEENAWVEAKIVRVPSPAGLSSGRRRALSTSFDQSGDAVALARGKVAARWSPVIRFPKRQLASGWYVYAVKVTAEMSPSRTSTFVSDAFQVA